MASWRERAREAASAAAVWCALLPASGCSVGRGEGELTGRIAIEDCAQREYSLRPTFFAAEPTQQEGHLDIRVQRGSASPGVSDGIHVLVRNAEDVQAELLGEDIPVDNQRGPVGVTLFLNQTCGFSRTTTPATLPAISGTIRFHGLYAPLGDEDQVEIFAELEDVYFEDPRNLNRSAELSGYFRFLFERGRPAQLFP